VSRLVLPLPGSSFATSSHSRSKMVKFTAGFALASLFSVANGAGHTMPFKVRVRNLTYLQPFSPPLIVAHTKDVALFKEGFPANDAIKLMA
ncbi:unnamed protein product, partial [Scytosiphon promiscuus]